MISFWLLCWKLLRATTGLRRTAELMDSSHSTDSPDNVDPVSNPSNPLQSTDPDRMEISSSSPITDLEQDNLGSWCSQKAEELPYPDSHHLQQAISERRKEEEAAEGDGNISGDTCGHRVFDTSKEIEVEIGEVKGEGEEVEDGARGEIKENEKNGEIVSEEWGRTEIEKEEEVTLEVENEGIIERGETTKEEQRAGKTVEDPLIFDEMCSSSSEPLNYAAHLHVSLDSWGHDPCNRGNVSEDHLSDCLQAELAFANSDSDAGEDQLASFETCDIISRTDVGGQIHQSICDGEFKEGEKGRDNEEEDIVETIQQRESDVEGEQEKTGGGKVDDDDDDDDDDEQLIKRKPLLGSPDSSTASSTDPDRRVPVDFCVHQDTLSEHVSTEHVDFLLARQQWKKMEEEVKGQPIPKPGLRTPGSFQGTHTSLYPPTRSPRLKHKEIPRPVPQEPPLSSTLSPSSEDSGLDDSTYRCSLEEPESAVEREIRLTLEREEQHRRERGKIAHSLTLPRSSTLQTGRSPPRPPACRTPTLSISPSPPCSSSLPRSIYHEMTANNVIILEPECSSSTSRNHLLSTAIGGLSDGPASLDMMPSTNVIVVETSNLIIRSASEFCLSSAPVSMETQETTFSSNPFYKLRSLSSQSLVEQEIRMVRQREEEWKRQREDMWKKRREEEWRKERERYDTVLVSPGLNDNITYSAPVVPDRCVSSPSSPSRTRKMERSSLSCDHKFPPSLSSMPRRQNTMAQRWEASLLTSQKKE